MGRQSGLGSPAKKVSDAAAPTGGPDCTRGTAVALVEAPGFRPATSAVCRMLWRRSSVRSLGVMELPGGAATAADRRVPPAADVMAGSSEGHCRFGSCCEIILPRGSGTEPQSCTCSEPNPARCGASCHYVWLHQHIHLSSVQVQGMRVQYAVPDAVCDTFMKYDSLEIM